ncbi:hypothetical protein D3C84_254420 [compost metagenome]
MCYCWFIYSCYIDVLSISIRMRTTLIIEIETYRGICPNNTHFDNRCIHLVGLLSMVILIKDFFLDVIGEVNFD